MECNEMSVSPVKRLILETMWMLDKPEKATDIAKDTGVNFPAVMMHILGLTRMGYVKTPEKGFYIITEDGKKSLGFPGVDKEKATEILAYLPLEKSFHFYADISKPLNVYAASLGDFCDRIKSVEIGSVEFHINRGDLEAWFNALGDVELARKILILRELKTQGENLRTKLCEIVSKRYNELGNIRKAGNPAEQV
jgi:DNA-binding transcriptional ArsR family regulator